MNSTPSIIAHRGASAYAPENTLPAFQLAWQLGANGIEGDFRLTADGQIVCIHDATTQRVADQNLAVETSNYASLRALKITSKGSQESAATHIPLLREVMATVPHGKQLFIELKTGPQIVPPLIEVLKTSGLAVEQIILFSFNSEVLEAIQALRLPYYTGLIIDFEINAHGELTPTIKASLDRAVQLGCSGLHVGANPRLPKYIGEQCQARGLQLHTWTVDTCELWRTMQALGVQSITTNKPDLLSLGLL